MLILTILSASLTASASVGDIYINTADCVDADITLRAKTMRYFNDGDAQVCLLKGDCVILFGSRRLSADSMVLWIYTATQNNRQYRRIDASLSGNVKVIENTAASVEDTHMLVTLMQTGHFTANVKQALADQGNDSPLYLTAKNNYQAAVAGLTNEPTPPSLDVSGTVLQDPDYGTSDKTDILPDPATPNSQSEPSKPLGGKVAIKAKPAPGISPQAKTVKVITPLPKPPTAALDDIKAGNINVVRAKQPVRFSADEIKTIVTPDDNGKFSKQVTICKGHLLISYGGREQTPAIDVQADAGVLFSNKNAGSNSKAAAGPMNISAAYLEGDIRMTSADRVIRAQKLYLDFETEQAVLTDVVAHSVDSDRRIPIYVRAKQARMMTNRDDIGQVISRDLTLESPKISVSEFFSPTYYIGASTVVLKDTTPRDSDGLATEAFSGGMKIYNPAAFVYGIPVSYWPYLASSRKVTDLPLTRLNVTRHSELGQGVVTRWKLLNLLGLQDPEGFDTRMELGHYTDGPGGGLDVEYKRDNYTGFAEGVLLYNKDGYKIDYMGQEDIESNRKTRYSYLWRHKHFLDKGWEIQLESSNENGDTLYTMARDDYWQDKERDNSLYIRKQHNNWAVSSLMRAGIYEKDNFTRVFQQDDWLLPQISAELIGQSIFGNTVTLFADANAAIRKRDLIQTNSEKKADGLPTINEKFRPEAEGRAELNLPVKLGPVNIVAAAGSTAQWEDYYQNEVYTIYGSVKANTTFWRVWSGASSRLLDIHKLRHLVTPEVVYYRTRSYHNFVTNNFNPDIIDNNNFHSSHNYGTSLRLKQRWQTYRGSKASRQVAELAGLNLALNTYSVTQYPKPNFMEIFSIGRYRFDRPELSRHTNNINGDMYFHFSSDTVLLVDAMYNVDDHMLTYANTGIAIQRNPRFRYYLGGRYYDGLRNNTDFFVGTAGFTYNIGRKYQLNVFQQYDFEYKDGQNLQTRITLLRSFPRWKAAVSLVSDESLDMNSFEFSLYPEGMPKSQIGDRVSTWHAAGAY